MSRSGIVYTEYAPHTSLRSVIECYWTVRDPVARADREPERIVPDACPEIILHLGDPFQRQIGSRWVRQLPMFLAGTLSRPWRLKPGRQVDTIGVRFRPGAIARLLAVDMATTVDRETSLSTWVAPGDLRERRRRLAAAHRPGRIRILDDWLVPLLGRAAPRGNDVTREAVQRLLGSRGTIRIDDVAAACGTTRRRLERLFARDLGIRPKLFARIVRLNTALTRLDRAERADAVGVALAAGYFDQAHMARDFRAVAGRPPGAGRAQDGALSRQFTRPERILAWLAGE